MSSNLVAAPDERKHPEALVCGPLPPDRRPVAKGIAH
jgi:hypothetical protein